MKARILAALTASCAAAGCGGYRRPPLVPSGPPPIPAGYPKFSVDEKEPFPIVQTYPGPRRPADKVAALGYETNLSARYGGPALSVSRIRRASDGTEWRPDSGDAIEVLPDSYEVTVKDTWRGREDVLSWSPKAGELFVLTPDGVALHAGRSLKDLRLSAKSYAWEYELPYVEKPTQSRSVSIQIGRHITHRGGESHVVTSIVAWKTYCVHHSSREDIESETGEPESTKYTDQGILCEYTGVTYGTELVKSTRSPRTLRLLFNKQGFLEQIRE